MIKVDQTKFVAGEGNCFPACIASILEVPLEEIPEVDESLKWGWMKPFNDYLAEKGLAFIDVCLQQHKLYEPPVGVLCILSGPSPRFDCDHSVVGRTQKDGLYMVHDPHPSRDGLKHVQAAGFFVTLKGSADVEEKGVLLSVKESSE